MVPPRFPHQVRLIASVVSAVLLSGCAGDTPPPAAVPTAVVAGPPAEQTATLVPLSPVPTVGTRWTPAAHARTVAPPAMLQTAGYLTVGTEAT